MLVLTRKAGEKLVIGNDIEVTVLEVRGDTIKIGIDAPKHVSIYRDEIYQEICKNNQQASSAPKTDVLDSASAFLKQQQQ